MLVVELERKIKFRDCKDLSVSQTAVSWQIDHSLRVMNVVFDTMLKNKFETKNERKFNFLKYVIFVTGIIPRGKAKAPKSVQSFDEITFRIFKKNS